MKNVQELKKNTHPYDHTCLRDSCSPHGYLIYIFKYCMDWSEIGFIMGFGMDGGGEEYMEFIKKHFNREYTSQIPIPELCDALKRAFH